MDQLSRTDLAFCRQGAALIDDMTKAVQDYSEAVGEIVRSPHFESRTEYADLRKKIADTHVKASIARCALSEHHALHGCSPVLSSSATAFIRPLPPQYTPAPALLR